MNSKQKVKTVLLFVLIVITAGCAFPFYNLTKSFGLYIVGMNLIMNVSCYAAMGAIERPLLKKWKFYQVAILNIGLILLGMLFRYLIEFGEVSNTYNFTGPNIALHIAAAFAISMVSYITSRQPT